jgi:hypothetical protein
VPAPNSSTISLHKPVNSIISAAGSIDDVATACHYSFSTINIHGQAKIAIDNKLTVDVLDPWYVLSNC